MPEEKSKCLNILNLQQRQSNLNYMLKLILLRNIIYDEQPNPLLRNSLIQCYVTLICTNRPTYNLHHIY